MREIIVELQPDGRVKIDAVGFSGPDCEQATQFLEEALGQATERQRKPEYHQHGVTRNRNQQRLGSQP